MAISSLFSTEFQEDLAYLVGYSEDSREQWWLTFLSSMRVVLERSVKLFLLNVSKSLPLQSPCFASWCPHFQARGAYKDVIRASGIAGAGDRTS